jgi:hypothetical protein
MKKIKHYFSLLLLLVSPLTAFAHGEEVLVTIFLVFIVFVILVVGLMAMKLNRTGKLVIGGVGILAMVLTSIVTDNLPYNQYRTMINILVVVVPLTIVTVSYVGLKNKFQRT